MFLRSHVDVFAGTYDTSSVFKIPFLLASLTALQMSHLATGEFLRSSNDSQKSGIELPSLTHLPCAAVACFLLLQQTGVVLSDKRCLLIGHGRLIGMPLTSLLLSTTQVALTICQEGTKRLQEEVRNADIVISATGQPELIKGEWINPGSVIIDCGINTLAHGISTRFVLLVVCAMLPILVKMNWVAH